VGRRLSERAHVPQRPVLLNSGNNDEQYCNKDYDALIDQAAAEPDATKQTALYNQAQELLMKDVPVIPLRFTTQTYEVQPYVHLVPTALDYNNYGDQELEYAWIEQH
jgi:ABC-type transport system substrate-binding protein